MQPINNLTYIIFLHITLTRIVELETHILPKHTRFSKKNVLDFFMLGLCISFYASMFKIKI